MTPVPDYRLNLVTTFNLSGDLGMSDHVKRFCRQNERKKFVRETDQVPAREFLTDYPVKMGGYTVKRWKNLDELLLVKYLNGNRKQGENGCFLQNEWGYPQPPSFRAIPINGKKS